MALGLAPAIATNLLDSLINSVGGDVWIKLHLGDPGAAGTANPAVNTTRMQAAFDPAVNGVATTNATITWSSVPATETYTRYSAWTASSGGTFLFSGTVSAAQVTATGNFVVAAGGLDVSFANVAA